MENSTNPNHESTATRDDRPNACPSWCTEHRDSGAQRPGILETWHTAVLGSLTMCDPIGHREPGTVTVEIQMLVTADLLEGTTTRGETSVSVLLASGGSATELLELQSGAECYRLAALLMQAGDDHLRVVPGRLAPQRAA